MRIVLACLVVLLFVTATARATVHIEDFNGSFDPFFNHSLEGAWSLGSTLILWEGTDDIMFNTAPGNQVSWARVTLKGGGMRSASVTFIGTLDSARFYNTQIDVYKTYDTEGLAVGPIRTIGLSGAIGESGFLPECACGDSAPCAQRASAI